MEQLRFPFNNDLWYCVIGGFFTGLAVIRIVNLLANRMNEKPQIISHFNMIRIYLCGDVNDIPANNFARLILLSWIIGCFWLRTTYEGVLFKFLIKPKNMPSPKTIDELIDANYTLLMPNNAFHLFQQWPKIHKL